MQYRDKNMRKFDENKISGLYHSKEVIDESLKEIFNKWKATQNPVPSLQREQDIVREINKGYLDNLVIYAQSKQDQNKGYLIARQPNGNWEIRITTLLSIDIYQIESRLSDEITINRVLELCEKPPDITHSNHLQAHKKNIQNKITHFSPVHTENLSGIRLFSKDYSKLFECIDKNIKERREDEVKKFREKISGELKKYGKPLEYFIDDIRKDSAFLCQYIPLKKISAYLRRDEKVNENRALAFKLYPILLSELIELNRLPSALQICIDNGEWASLKQGLETHYRAPHAAIALIPYNKSLKKSLENLELLRNLSDDSTEFNKIPRFHAKNKKFDYEKGGYCISETERGKVVLLTLDEECGANYEIHFLKTNKKININDLPKIPILINENNKEIKSWCCRNGCWSLIKIGGPCDEIFSDVNFARSVKEIAFTAQKIPEKLYHHLDRKFATHTDDISLDKLRGISKQNDNSLILVKQGHKYKLFHRKKIDQWKISNVSIEKDETLKKLNFPEKISKRVLLKNENAMRIHGSAIKYFDHLHLSDYDLNKEQSAQLLSALSSMKQFSEMIGGDRERNAIFKVLAKTLLNELKSCPEPSEQSIQICKKYEIETNDKMRQTKDTLYDYVKMTVLPLLVKKIEQMNISIVSKDFLFDQAIKQLLPTFSSHLFKDVPISQIIKLNDIWHTPQTQSHLYKFRDYGNKQWERLCEDQEVPETIFGEAAYKLVVLTSPAELMKEGEEQKHCAASYVSNCLNYPYHVISLRDRNGNRVSTIGIKM